MQTKRESGDEVITCALSPERSDRWGNHLHDDPCWEVRTVMDRTSDLIIVSDVLRGCRSVPESALVVAPLALLRRKTERYHRLVKLLKDWENWDQSSAHVLLDRVLQEVDSYTYCGEASAREQGENQAPDRESRWAFDRAAAYAMEHRRDYGLGRPRHKILQDVKDALFP